MKTLFENEDITLDILPDNNYRLTLFDNHGWSGEHVFNTRNIVSDDTGRSMKIYIIIGNRQIEYVGTDYEDSYHKFAELSQVCVDTEQTYEYELWEYNTCLDNSNKNFKRLLIHVDNIK